MQLNLNANLFEEQQAIFVRELVGIVRVKLLEAGLEGESLNDTTASIAFGIASLIDDTSAIEADGTEVHPYLTFRTSEDTLTHCGENAYSHEMVYEVMKKMLGA